MASLINCFLLLFTLTFLIFEIKAQLPGLPAAPEVPGQEKPTTTTPAPKIPEGSNASGGNKTKSKKPKPKNKDGGGQEFQNGGQFGGIQQLNKDEDGPSYRPNRGDEGIPIGKNLGYFSGGVCFMFRIADLVLGFRRWDVVKSFLPALVVGGNATGNVLMGDYQFNLAGGLLNDVQDDACLHEDVHHFQFAYFT